MINWIREQLRKRWVRKNVEIPLPISTIWHRPEYGRLYLKFRCPACKQRYRLYDINELEAEHTEAEVEKLLTKEQNLAIQNLLAPDLTDG